MSNPEFQKYPSIDNTYRTKAINYIRQHECFTDEWVVLLKVHGENFSFYCDGDTVLTGRKLSFTEDGDGFAGHKEVVERLNDNILKATSWLQRMAGAKEVRFFGELFGGSYNHPDIKRENHASRIQKGVYYCPQNEFYLVDIMVDGEFLSHSAVEMIGEDFDIMYAKPLLRGTFDECLAHSNLFPDPLHKEFGLPEIEGNVCEGIVIKPVSTAYFGNGKRIILKNKNDKFKENNGEKKNKVPQVVKWSPEGLRLHTLLSTYISLNRLTNVMSHGHSIKQKEFGKLMGLLSKDVWDDFYIDYGDEYDYLEENEQKKIKKSMSQMCAILIRPYFQDIVDGEF